MINEIKYFLKNIYKKYSEDKRNNRIKNYRNNNRIPWSVGYEEYKYEKIAEIANDQNFLLDFKNKKLIKNYGFRLDERIIEYPWLINNLSDTKCNLLDAGSVLNFEFAIKQSKLKNKNLFIYNLYPESVNFNNKKISYIYGDLRNIPFKDSFFDEIICISTLEHIDMDNSIYGANNINNEIYSKEKNYNYLIALSELVRILNANGVLLLSFPYGKFENHGFFQQFDNEMTERILDFLKIQGTFENDFFIYKDDGWHFSDRNNCEESESYNFHTGIGKKNDFAAHSRSICCIKFIKN